MAATWELVTVFVLWQACHFDAHDGGDGPGSSHDAFSENRVVAYSENAAEIAKLKRKADYRHCVRDHVAMLKHGNRYYTLPEEEDGEAISGKGHDADDVCRLLMSALNASGDPDERRAARRAANVKGRFTRYKKERARK